jgi:hypothetical protein
MRSVAQWTVFEIGLRADRDYADPFWDVDVEVHFRDASGRTKVVNAFWDGASHWRVRFSPDALGPWQWETSCSRTADVGLHGQGGEFECVPYEGDNPLYRRGAVRLSPNRRHLVWANGDPFFWLADTAWNGVLRATETDWERYLDVRRQQEFTAVQFVSTEWRGGRRLLGEERAYTGTERIRVHPGFFRRRDGKVAAINSAGLIAAPVILWALGEDDPGQSLPEEDAVRLARYIVARWGAYHVVWFLGGDGNYLGEKAERWRRIGRAAFPGSRDRLVTMHPCGQTWVAPEFRGEPWYDFVGYQSGHGSSEEHLDWLVAGPPATDWPTDPPLPIINLEPNYEGHPSYHANRTFAAHEVRRAACWSLLVSPPAGVSYGTNPIWVWSARGEIPEGHDSIGHVASWQDGLDLPGIASMSRLRSFFETLPWWTLRPAPDLLIVQPGDEDSECFVAAALSQDGDIAVAYTPTPDPLHLNVDLLPNRPVVCWYDVRTGEWTDACAVPDESGVIAPPGEGDWLLCVRGHRGE